MEKIAKRKMTDTKLNIWVKNLNRVQKSLFFEKLFNNDLLWLSLDDIERRKRFDNYRYLEVAKPSHFNAILIYVSALYIDPDLKMEILFPDIPESYTSVLIPLLTEKSLQTNNFNRC